jgi:hypothetical protein
MRQAAVFQQPQHPHLQQRPSSSAVVPPGAATTQPLQSTRRDALTTGLLSAALALTLAGNAAVGVPPAHADDFTTTPSGLKYLDLRWVGLIGE